MKNIAQRSRILTLLVGFLLTTSVYAEDIDLFTRAAPNASTVRPNVLIVLDSSANWSAANQQWPGGIKQGQAELRALRRLLSEVKDNVNIGLMMFTDGSGQNKNAAYLRFHVRHMTTANRK